MDALARVYKSVGRYQEAEPLLLDAAERINRTLGSEHRRADDVNTALAELYEARNEPEKAAIHRALLEDDDG